MKHLFWILGLWCMGQTYAQDYQDTWTGFFSFVSIKDVAQSEDRIYVASENAVYSFDIWSGDIETLTTINGLSGESITEIHYSQTYGLLMIGHDNGLIELLSDNSDQVVQIVDILEKPSIPPNIKRINHFYEYGAQLYIATDYGISVYDLNALEFGGHLLYWSPWQYLECLADDHTRPLYLCGLSPERGQKSTFGRTGPD